ncbi:hypothetical protein BH23PSE1_BH23PSE1_00930 [soil metagenome]
MFRMPILASGAVLAVVLGVGAGAAAQDGFPACQSQQSIEQIIASGGELMPDDCQQLTVTAITSDHGPLCVIDFSGAGAGILDTLRAAALPEQWWVRCESLGAAQ